MPKNSALQEPSRTGTLTPGALPPKTWSALSPGHRPPTCVWSWGRGPGTFLTDPHVLPHQETPPQTAGDWGHRRPQGDEYFGERFLRNGPKSLLRNHTPATLNKTALATGRRMGRQHGGPGSLLGRFWSRTAKHVRFRLLVSLTLTSPERASASDGMSTGHKCRCRTRRVQSRPTARFALALSHDQLHRSALRQSPHQGHGLLTPARWFSPSSNGISN